MRNWNKIQNCHFQSAEIMFLQYLWGIETSIAAASKVLACWFLQYLWGIETYISTIEPQQRGAFLQYLWGIETELRWNRQGRIYSSFYSTYEELKRVDSPRFHLLQASVFTVPMRNWNPENKAEPAKVTPVFTVPMRNWNLMKISSFSKT